MSQKSALQTSSILQGYSYTSGTDFKYIGTHIGMNYKRPRVMFIFFEIRKKCQAGDSCTLREATIVCACLREHSIPPLHAAAGLLKISEMDYNGVNSLFLRVLIEKKYALVRTNF